MTASKNIVLHASCVALNGTGVLITGEPGAGKSSLALELLSLGCSLVADDRTEVKNQEDSLVASCPESIRGKIEARGVGILAAEPVLFAVIGLIVDLDIEEHERLPQIRTQKMCGVDIPLLHRSVQTHFSAAVVQYIKGGRIA